MKRRYCLVFILVMLFLTPEYSVSAESFYTVQAGSHTDMKGAEKQFELIAQSLKGKDLDYLRVEKIGRYYSVRVGKFNSRAPAKALLNRNQKYLATSAVMKAYYIEDRILKSLTAVEPVKTTVSTPAKPTKKTEPKTAKIDVSKPPQKKTTGPGKELFTAVSDKVANKKYSKALDIIKPNLSKWPDSSELNGWYGAIHLKMNNPSEALKYFKKASALSPEVSDYHNGAGYSLLFLNRSNDAIKEFKKAVKLEPKHIDALAGIGLAYIKIGNQNEALGYYKKLKDLDDNAAGKLLKLIDNMS